MGETKNRYVVQVNLNVFKAGIGYSTQSWEGREYESEEEAEKAWKQVGEYLKKLEAKQPRKPAE